MGLDPKIAIIIKNDIEQEILIEEIKVGELPGIKILVDIKAIICHLYTDESILSV